MCTTFSSEPLMVVNPQSHWKYSGGFHPVNLELVVTEPIPHIPWIQLWLHVQKHGGFLGTPPWGDLVQQSKARHGEPGSLIRTGFVWAVLGTRGWMTGVDQWGLIYRGKSQGTSRFGCTSSYVFFWTCYMFHDVMHLVLITQHNILRSSQVYKSMSIICLTNRDMVGQDLSYILIAYFVKTMWFT